MKRKIIIEQSSFNKLIRILEGDDIEGYDELITFLSDRDSFNIEDYVEISPKGFVIDFSLYVDEIEFKS